jgi:hypothetical protein
LETAAARPPFYLPFKSQDFLESSRGQATAILRKGTVPSGVWHLKFDVQIRILEEGRRAIFRTSARPDLL